MGDAPARLAGVLPVGAEVVGTVYPETPSADGAVVIARLVDSPAAAALAFERALPDGWHRLADSEGQDPGGGTSTGGPDRGVVLCADGEPEAPPVRVGFAERPGGGALAVASTTWTRRGCDGEIDRLSPYGPSDTPDVGLSELPALAPPPGGQQEVHGSGGGTDTEEQDATLTWAGGAVEHYGRQLAAAGWTALASGGDADVAAGAWTRTAGSGPRTVSISVVRAAPLELELRLHLIAFTTRDG